MIDKHDHPRGIGGDRTRSGDRCQLNDIPNDLLVCNPIGSRILGLSCVVCRVLCRVSCVVCSKRAAQPWATSTSKHSIRQAILERAVGSGMCVYIGVKYMKEPSP